MLLHCMPIMDIYLLVHGNNTNWKDNERNERKMGVVKKEKFLNSKSFNTLIEQLLSKNYRKPHIMPQCHKEATHHAHIHTHTPDCFTLHTGNLPCLNKASLFLCQGFRAVIYRKGASLRCSGRKQGSDMADFSGSAGNGGWIF